MKTSILVLAVVTSLTASGQSAGVAPADAARAPFALFISSRSVFALGAPVEVKVRMTNTSNHDLNMSAGTIKGYRYGYTYDVRDEVGTVLQQKPIDFTHQFSVVMVTLKPGQSREVTTNITEAYDLQPGKYTVQLSMPVSGKSGAEVVTSNKITIAIMP